MKSAPPGRCEARPKTASVPVGAGFGVLGGVFADAPEKSAEERAALVGQETRVQFRVVVEPGILEEIHEAAADARLGTSVISRCLLTLETEHLVFCHIAIN